MTEILSAQEVLKAWDWFRNGVPTRQNATGVQYLFDDLNRWLDSSNNRLLNSSNVVVSNTAKLYLISELGFSDETNHLINNTSNHSVIIQGQKIDPDAKSVISNKKRFRHGLSEHLAFWIRAAQAANGTGRIAISKPNFQPEDKGPDGVYIKVDENTCEVEALSVKSSEKNLKKIIASSSYRKKGVPGTAKMMLDDFHKLINENHGVTRLQDKLIEVGNTLNFDAAQFIRSGFLAKVSCHGFSVADHTHASPNLYEGFENLNVDKSRKLATHVGADQWVDFAENVRKECVSIFTSKAAW